MSHDDLLGMLAGRMAWCPSRISAEGLAGSFNMARKHDPNPTEYKGLQLWAAQQIWLIAVGTGVEAAGATTSVTREAETFASSGLCPFARSVAMSRELSRSLGSAYAVLYGSLKIWNNGHGYSAMSCWWVGRAIRSDLSRVGWTA